MLAGTAPFEAELCPGGRPASLLHAATRPPRFGRMSPTRLPASFGGAWKGSSPSIHQHFRPRDRLEPCPFNQKINAPPEPSCDGWPAGYRVPIVQTECNAPLPDARESTTTAARSGAWLHPRALLTIGLATVVIVSGAWLGLRVARPQPPTLRAPRPSCLGHQLSRTPPGWRGRSRRRGCRTGQPSRERWAASRAHRASRCSHLHRRSTGRDRHGLRSQVPAGVRAAHPRAGFRHLRHSVSGDHEGTRRASA
jgi:hypothetical protein